jgi:hypothetical protein
MLVRDEEGREEGRRNEMNRESGITKKDLQEALQKVGNRTAALIAGEVGTLHVQIQQSEMRLTAKIDDINTRLDMHAGLLQTGARQMTRFVRFSERSTRNWQTLAKRVDALERRNGGKAKP